MSALGRRPRLLDLFCGAGGATRGYQEAGFWVMGVDSVPQPHYCGDAFVQQDALSVPVEGYDVIHASPPCQAYSVAKNIHGRRDYPDLVAATRERLQAAGVPYVIENVVGAPLHSPITLCGLSFGLGVRRHRLFESNVLLFALPCVGHKQPYVICFGSGVRGRAAVSGRAKGGGPVIYRPVLPLEHGKRAMGIDWMHTGRELAQAIPPAYTRWIGGQLRCYV